MLSTLLSHGQVDDSHERSIAERRIASLEQELGTMRAEAQSVHDAHNTANGKIRASNEKLQSINSALETSNAELQMINAAMIVTNQELHTSSDRFRAAAEDSEAIVEAVLEPFMVISEDLRVQRANTAFYQCFKVFPEETEGVFLNDLGNGQWNILRLRALIEQVLTTNRPFHDFEVEHTFPLIGRKVMVLNGRRILREHEQIGSRLLLLAIKDITRHKKVARQKDALPGLASHELKMLFTNVKLLTRFIYRFMERVNNE
jgi:two-component system CheB/CheR fusion protein